MGVPYFIMADVNIPLNSLHAVPPMSFKGKGALIFLGDPALIIFLVYTPKNGTYNVPLEVPQAIADNITVGGRAGWVKEIDLPEGKIEALIDATNLSVGPTNAYLYFVPNEY